MPLIDIDEVYKNPVQFFSGTNNVELRINVYDTFRAMESKAFSGEIERLSGALKILIEYAKKIGDHYSANYISGFVEHLEMIGEQKKSD